MGCHNETKTHQLSNPKHIWNETQLPCNMERDLWLINKNRCPFLNIQKKIIHQNNLMLLPCRKRIKRNIDTIKPAHTEAFSGGNLHSLTM